MTEQAEASGPLGPEPAPGVRRRRRGVFRRYVFPLLVIGAIVAVIWWIDYRPGGGSSSGGRYGPVDLPAALAPTGADVSAKEGGLAPDFLLEGLADGQEIRLSDLRGKPIVLNFWATWCAPCRKEIPQFVDAYDRLRNQGLVIIGVNMQEGKSIVGPYAKDFGMDFPIAIDRNGDVGERYRLLGLPMTFFIDRRGVIRSIFTGPFTAQEQGTNVQGAIGQTELDQRIAAIMAPAGGQ